MIRCAAVICFTENGSKEAEKVRKCLGAHNVAVKLAKKYRGAADSISEPLEEWTGREFKAQDALIYIGRNRCPGCGAVYPVKVRGSGGSGHG